MNTETPNSANTSPTNSFNNVPAPKSTAFSSTQTLNPRSCVTCRRRKVRCDKISPCSNCIKAHTQCDFPAPGRAPRRSKSGLAAKGASEREAELLKRLRRLEGVVEELSGQVDVVTSEDGNQASIGSPQNSNSDKPTVLDKSGVRLRMDEGNKSGRISTPLDSQTPTEFGRLVIDEGKSRYVSNTFWASLSEEVDDIHGILEGGLSDEDDGPSPDSNGTMGIDMQDHHSFILGYSSSNVNLRALHPLPSQIPFYWEVFIENVDPIVKIMHKPTMERTIREVKENLDSLEKSTEALMFSLYFAVITSMTDEEVKTNFGLEKTVLLKRYRFAVEQALARAGFLNTSEIVTVQAFVLFLVCVRRHDDSRFVWTLTGLAIRIAQSLGLHRDGAIFGLSPFDTEMRRRLWHQVCVLDVRASEDHGTDPSILEPSYDTKFPLNIDDDQLDPEATEPPEPKVGVSELSFCLVRYEICQVSRKLNYTPPGASFCREKARTTTLAEKEKIVQDCHEMMESKYLQYFTGVAPLFWVAATVSRLVIAKMGLIIYHPLHNNVGIRKEIPKSTLERLFIASIEIIEYSRLLETEPSTKKWGWLFHTYVQWHAIAYLLGELCIRDLDENCLRAWAILDMVFKDWSESLRQSKNGLLWIPIRKLMARARRKREMDIARQREEARLVAEKSEEEEQGSGNPFLASDVTESEEYKNLYFANQYSMSPNLSSARINNSTGGGTDGPAGSLGVNYNPTQNCPTASQPQAPQQLSGFPPQTSMPIPPTNFPAMSSSESPDFDMDMDALSAGDTGVEWQGWDDLVREFQLDEAVLDGGQGRNNAVLGEMGTWW